MLCQNAEKRRLSAPQSTRSGRARPGRAVDGSRAPRRPHAAARRCWQWCAAAAALGWPSGRDAGRAPPARGWAARRERWRDAAGRGRRGVASGGRTPSIATAQGRSAFQLLPGNVRRAAAWRAPRPPMRRRRARSAGADTRSRQLGASSAAQWRELYRLASQRRRQLSSARGRGGALREDGPQQLCTRAPPTSARKQRARRVRGSAATYALCNGTHL